MKWISAISGFCAVAAMASCAGDTPRATVRQAATTSAVITQRYDNRRSGVNANETTLNPALVESFFGKVADSGVLDGSAIFAQPLYVDGITTNAQAADGSTTSSTANVLYVATNFGSIYILDAATLAVRWHRQLRPPYAAPSPIGTHGIISTPVIDRAAGTLYVVAQDASGDFYLHAIRLDNLQDIHVVKISATAPGGGVLQPKTQFNRPGLLLLGGQIYVAFGSDGVEWVIGSNQERYRGWIIGYDASTLNQTSVFCAEPDPIAPTNSEGAGIWQSGTGLVADDKGIYFLTGNGQIDATHVGDSFVRLPYAGSTLAATATFTPPRGQDGELLDEQDLDLGSSAPTLIGDNLVLGGGKEGVLYLLDRTTTPLTLLQSFRASYNQFSTTYCEPAIPSCGAQSRPGPGITAIAPGQDPAHPPTVVTSCTEKQGKAPDSSYQQITETFPHLHSAPVYWAPSGLAYIWAERDQLRAYRFDPVSQRFTGQAGAAPELFCANTVFARPSANAGDFGGFLSISANGDDPNSGVLWALVNEAPGSDPTATHAVLHAYRALADKQGMLPELWNSDANVNDKLPSDVGHFALPMAANGRVYVSAGSYTNGRIVAYGQRWPSSHYFLGAGQWLTNWSKPDFAGAGDFNGDGKADLAWYEAWNNDTITIVTSDGSAHFYSAGGWLSGWGKPDWAGVGDFNGDGKADLVWYTAWDKSITMALSTGTGFQTAVWLTGWGKPDWAGVGDFNGDGKADVVWYEASTRRFTMALSTGVGFNTAIWLTGWGPPDWAGVGDFNGDGKADIAWYEAWNNGGSVTLALSTGSGFGGGVWLSGWGKPDWAAAADFDGDGKADLAWYEAWNNGAITVALFDGAGHLREAKPWLTGWGMPDLALAGDFDGDHRADIGWYEIAHNYATTVSLAR